MSVLDITALINRDPTAIAEIAALAEFAERFAALDHRYADLSHAIGLLWTAMLNRKPQLIRRYAAAVLVECNRVGAR